MLERVPTVLTPQEILDKAFHRAQSIHVPDPVRYHRIRKTEAARMASVCDTIAETLARFPAAFPNLDNLRDYDREVLDILAGLPRLRKALGSVRWAAGKVRDIHEDARRRMLRVRTVEGVKRIQNACYGRVSSIVKEVGPDLAFLADVRDRARLLPSVSPDFATVVIAGFPNVGKSSLLRAWTAAKPEIAAYAFTTKHAEVGHIEVEDVQGTRTKVQFVDTPGLLDRADKDRNDVERQAVAALRHAADAVLFLLDPTETCGYPLDKQEALLAQVRKDMTGVPIIVGETKADLADPATVQEGRIRFSTTTGDGLEALRTAVLEAIRMEEPDLEIDPLDAWRVPEPGEDW